MYDVARRSLRIAGLLAIAAFVAHCGDSSVHIRTGSGVSPTAGTFVGTTDQGGVLTIQVGSIEAIAFDCDGTPIAESFSPPRQVNADGTFSVSFSDGGRQFHVSGQFSDNNNVDGNIDDEDNDCDTGFEASRAGGPFPTATPGPGSTKTSTPIVGQTQTPNGGETATPNGGETATPNGGETGTANGGETPTPTSTASGASCPSKITFTGTSTNGVLDTGWTGQGHDATVISEGTVTVSVTSCTGTAPNCGVCSYTGPIANDASKHEVQTQRCSADSAIACTGDQQCTGHGTCKFFFGTYLPLAAGGVSTCVENTFNAGITGTADIGAGTSAGTAKLTSRVFSGPTLSQPCPQCNGDTTHNDGLKGGTCDSGLHAGATCDASGSSPNIAFGTTSLDCPPLSGGVIATLPIDLSNTTGTKAKTLSADSPNCRANGTTTLKCQCDTCATSAAEPCSTNGDCPGGAVCGGKRCISGSNAGHACTLPADCPNSACGVPGAATAPNQCDDLVCSAGVCANGPFDQFCSPVETFRGCTTNGDCTRAGDACTGGKNRPCFDSGNLNDTVSATGQADPPTNHQSDPTLAALFCIGPTSSSGVNSAAGLPGLGRLELQGHATDNGTP